MSRHLVSACLTVACVAAIATGCGSSGSSSTSQASSSPRPLSGPAYRQALHQIALEEDMAQHLVQHAFTAHTVAQVRADLTTFAGDQQRASNVLASLSPPADAVAANTQLARAFAGNATAIHSVLTKISTASTVKQALRVIQHDRAAQQVGQQIDAALAKLKRLGYASGS